VKPRRPSRRILLAPALLTAAALACGAPAPAPEADIILEPTVRPTAVEAAPAAPTAPAAAPTEGTPMIAFAFRDDFSGSLDSGWSWYQSDSPGWSLDHTPGWLRLNLSSGSFFGAAPPHNLLLRTAPAGDFAMQTFLRFSPHNNFEIAGLVVLFDDHSVLQFGRGFCFSEAGAPACIGDALYFDNVQDGSPVGGNFAVQALLGLDYQLQLERQGNAYLASYTTDGSSWMPIGSHTVDKSPMSIGLIAAQSTVASPYADFDYFEVTSES
jgi:Beta xylosidase C-terminal Concanavalin A-like domain